MPQLRNYLDQLFILELSRANVVGSALAGSSVDMKTCRDGVVLISLTKGTDSLTAITFQDSPDDSTFTTHTSITSVTSSGFSKTNVKDIKRYCKINWTGDSNTDSYACALLVGFRAIKKPVS